MFPLETIRPVPQSRKDRDPDTVMSRSDLWSLIESIRTGVNGLEGKEALSRAGRIISAFVAGRHKLDPRFASSHWKRDLLKLSRAFLALGSDKPLPRRWKAPFRIFNLNGNTKLPFAAFSTLPVVTCPGAGECAGWCYSFTAWRYPSAFSRQLQNTMLLWFAPQLIRTAFAALPSGVTLRLYVDGDFDSATTVRLWSHLLSSRPDVNAYGYSKSWDLLLAHPMPSNYRLNLSTGGKSEVPVSAMLALPMTRGVFATVPVDYRNPKGGRTGFARYADDKYHDSVREAARASGIVGPIFSCPGVCGNCAGGKHACGSDRFKGITIINGAH